MGKEFYCHCIVMQDMINEDLVISMQNIEKITDRINELSEAGEEPPKELYVLLNEQIAVSDSCLNMRLNGF